MAVKSIRLALTLWYSLTLAVILVIFSTFIYLTIRTQLYAELDRELLAIAEAVASPTLEPFRHTPPSVLDQVLEDFIGTKVADKYVQLSDGTGKVISRSRNLASFPLTLNPRKMQTAATGSITYQTLKTPTPFLVRTVSIPIVIDSRLEQIVQVGAPLTDATEILDKMLLMFVLSIPASVILLGSGGWFLAGRALKPVELITESAQKISAENLGQRLEIVNPDDEIGRLAQTFNKTLDRLEQSFNRIRRFSTDVSHELRTPLTIIRGETEMGLRSVHDPEDFRDILRSNLDEIDRMSKIVGHLLDLSRVEGKGLILNKGSIDLQGLLHDLVTTAMPRANGKNINLTFPEGKPIYMEGDHYRVLQIFTNLLDNAMKFTPQGGEIAIRLDCSDAWATVSVRDSGPGIPEADVPYVFDRFYRVDASRNRNYGGLGLGLALAEALTNAQGGRIELQSEQGKGSTFIVHFPIDKTQS